MFKKKVNEYVQTLKMYKGCEIDKVKVNSSGEYVFGDKSFSKGVVI